MVGIAVNEKFLGTFRTLRNGALLFYIHDGPHHECEKN